MKSELNIFCKRAVLLFLTFCLLTISLIGRIAFLQSAAFSATANSQFIKKVKLGETRGYIYDVNYLPLVNNAKNKKSVFLSCVQNKDIIEHWRRAEELCKGLCVTADTEDNYAETDYLKNYYTVDRYKKDKLCPHIIGYLNSEGRGIYGIEKAFDGILKKAGGSLYVNFEADARGYAIPGKGMKTENKNYDSPAGISLTIDKNVQLITENALKNSSVKSGAAVVMDVNSFRIIASASVPAFDADSLSASLKNNDSPFINRTFSPYPVGSVFKPFVAAAAIENGWDYSEEIECKGFIKKGGNTFNCYNSTPHGRQTLKSAIENSCNTFFIDIGLKAGAEKLIETASLFGFGKKTEMCSSLVSAAGNLPDAESIISSSQLANICFGQGELLATPVQIAAAYSVIANGGTYTEPSILNELIDADGKAFGYYKPETSYKAAEEKTCEILKECLYSNMLDGTGQNGLPDNVTAAGKTATAQTGIFDKDGREKLCTWFAGFFPYEKPVFAVVVFNEKGSAAYVDCAPVFKEIAEQMVILFNAAP